VEQLDLVRRAVDLLEGLGAAYMLVGSYGSAAWGEPTFTQDIDVVVRLAWGDVEPLVARWAQTFGVLDVWQAVGRRLGGG